MFKKTIFIITKITHVMRSQKIKNPKTALVAFAKDPSRVEVKTRLSSWLVDEERKLIYTSLLAGCLNKLSTIEGGEVYLACYPNKNSPFFEQLVKDSNINLIDQIGDNLGSKMESCFCELIKSHQKVIIFGTDIAYLPVNEIDSSIKQASNWDVLIGPSYDGGYYAIGLNTNEFKGIFTDVTWSTESVLAKTVENCDELGLKINYLPGVRDIDTIEDLLLLNSQLENSDTGIHTEVKEALTKINFKFKRNKIQTS